MINRREFLKGISGLAGATLLIGSSIEPPKRYALKDVVITINGTKIKGYEGLTFEFHPENTNTGPSTININSQGRKKIISV